MYLYVMYVFFSSYYLFTVILACVLPERFFFLQKMRTLFITKTVSCCWSVFCCYRLHLWLVLRSKGFQREEIKCFIAISIHVGIANRMYKFSWWHSFSHIVIPSQKMANVEKPLQIEIINFFRKSYNCNIICIRWYL